MNPPTAKAARRRASRSSVSPLARADVVRAVMLPAVTVVIVYFLCIVPVRQAAPAAEDGIGRVALVQKDASWRPLPPHPGAPGGGVWYTARGEPFRFELRARGLRSGTHYLIEVNVDGASYEVAQRTATAAGEITLDTSLSAFADGACAGVRSQDSRPLRGTHHIKFLLKRNGALPAVGPAGATPRTSNAPCPGNGDADFTYVLFEEKVATYDASR